MKLVAPSALLRQLERETQASQKQSIATLPDGSLTVWRVSQPGHRINVPPLAGHLVALHLAGPTKVRSAFAGDRPSVGASKPGDVTVLPVGCDWRSEVLGPRIDFMHMIVSEARLTRFAEGIDGGPSACSRLSARLADVDTTIERCGLLLLKAVVHSDIVETEALADELCLGLLERAGAKAQGPVKGGLTPAQVRRAIEFMSSNLDHCLSLEDIASALDLSPFHFARCFRATVGMPPHKFLTRLRIAEAKRLLRNRDETVAMIAGRTGFGSPAGLSRTFASTLGLSPTSYRRLMTS